METVVIPLTQGYSTIIDAEDLDRVMAASTCWQANKLGNTVYAAARASRAEGHRCLGMHRVIMREPVGLLVDHINHDALDNRKSNLRIVTKQQNQCNVLPRKGTSSRFKGVSYNKHACLWQAYINVFGKRSSLGYFRDEVAAARAYDEASVRLHGEFGFRNLTAA